MAMLPIRKLTTIASITLLAIALTACDSGGDNDDDNNQPPGSFSIVVAGDMDLEMDGFAFFGEAEHPDTGEDVFVIYFSESANPSNPQGRWAFVGRNSGRPGTGTFSFVNGELDGELPDDQFILVMTVGSVGAGSSTFVSDSGELSITSSSSNRVEGSFEVTATGFEISGGGTGEELNVTIEGSFDALGNDDIVIPIGE